MLHSYDTLSRNKNEFWSSFDWTDELAKWKRRTTYLCVRVWNIPHIRRLLFSRPPYCFRIGYCCFPLPKKLVGRVWWGILESLQLMIWWVILVFWFAEEEPKSICLRKIVRPRKWILCQVNMLHLFQDQIYLNLSIWIIFVEKHVSKRTGAHDLLYLLI